jgi:uncharacterized membrane protein
MTRRSQAGQTTILVVGFALVCFSVCGLAVDGTKAFLLRRTLQNAADAASTAGASQLDTAAYYLSGGRKVDVDPARARLVAAKYLSLRGIAAQAGVTADPSGVVVELRTFMRTTFLGLVGIDSVEVSANARAEPVAGRP